MGVRELYQLVASHSARTGLGLEIKNATKLYNLDQESNH